jgi:hypothetical protein
LFRAGLKAGCYKRGGRVVDDYGWGSDHYRTFLRLQQAVRLLAEAKGKTNDRLDRVTNCFVTVMLADFPKHLRKRAETVLSLRGKYAVRGAGGYILFRDVTPTDRKKFVRDLLTLYEACLIDLGSDPYLRAIMLQKYRDEH